MRSIVKIALRNLMRYKRRTLLTSLLITIGVLAVLQPAADAPRPQLDEFAATHRLSPREQEVLVLLREGLTTLAVAERLGITSHTVRDHIKNLYRKTGSGSRGELLGLVI